MGAGDDLSATREDAAQRAKEGQTSFEAFASTGTYDPTREDSLLRSVSEGEGIAAFALLKCGQPFSRPSSRNDVHNCRVDSSAWGDLLASGGESVPPLAPSRMEIASGAEDQRRTDSTSSSTTSSSNSTSTSDMGLISSLKEPDEKTPLELGPMPDHAPFASRRPGSGSASRNSRRKSSGSRTGPDRVSSTGSSSSLLHFLNSNFSRSSSGGEVCARASYSDGPSWPNAALPFPGRAGRGIEGVDAVVAWRSSYGDNAPARQHSFDPHKDIDIHQDRGIGVGSLLASPWLRSGPPAGGCTDVPIRGAGVVYDERRLPPVASMPGRGWETAAGRNGGSQYRAYHRDNFSSSSASPPPQAWTQKTHPELPRCKDEMIMGVTTAPAEIQNRAPASTPARKRNEHLPKPRYEVPRAAGEHPAPSPVGAPVGAGEHPPPAASWTPALPPAVDACPPPRGGHQGQHSRKRSFNLLAMKIPGLSSLCSGGGGLSGGVASEQGEAAVPQVPEGARAFGVDRVKTPYVPVATAPTKISFPSPRPGTTEPLVERGTAIDSVCLGGHHADELLGGEQGQRSAKREEILARYRRKKKRRLEVMRSRENDPFRLIQNKSRERPRKDGKFCKTIQDYVSITKMQQSFGSRSISGELAISDPMPSTEDNRGDGP